MVILLIIQLLAAVGLGGRIALTRPTFIMWGLRNTLTDRPLWVRGLFSLFSGDQSICRHFGKYCIQLSNRLCLKLLLPFRQCGFFHTIITSFQSRSPSLLDSLFLRLAIIFVLQMLLHQSQWERILGQHPFQLVQLLGSPILAGYSFQPPSSWSDALLETSPWPCPYLQLGLSCQQSQNWYSSGPSHSDPPRLDTTQRDHPSRCCWLLRCEASSSPLTHPTSPGKSSPSLIGLELRPQTWRSPPGPPWTNSTADLAGPSGTVGATDFQPLLFDTLCQEWHSRLRRPAWKLAVPPFQQPSHRAHCCSRAPSLSGTVCSALLFGTHRIPSHGWVQFSCSAVTGKSAAALGFNLPFLSRAFSYKVRRNSFSFRCLTTSETLTASVLDGGGLAALDDALSSAGGALFGLAAV